jgi:tRNA pseudouridine55 synthase
LPPSSSAPSGILVVDKPIAWTSHDVVAVCRGALGVRRVGHGGTLDPHATGVLPVLVGTATKFADRFREAAKVYDAHVRFGAETATDDRDGAVTREAAAPSALTVGQLDAALERFRGAIRQVPPAYAAVKVGGTAAYARARRGEAVALAERSVTVDRLTVAEWSPPLLRLLVVCSSGTYVRALARDLGRAVGSAAHLAGLTRLAVGALELAQAVSVERVRAEPDAARAALVGADESVLALDGRFLRDDVARLVAARGLL